jgi:hypothetical protein
VDTDRKFETSDLLDDLAGQLEADTGPERLLRSLLWDRGPVIARTQALGSVVGSARIAWQALLAPTHDEDREGSEQALWLRKLAEHLATLVCFGERDDPRDYWLWMVLLGNHEAGRIIGALETELTITPTRDQLDRVLGRTWSSEEISSAVRERYPPDSDPPWFVGMERWERLLNGEVEAVDKWRPLNMRAIMDRARPQAHPLEVSVMGHYQLAYGRYSSHIHARLAGDLSATPPMEEEVLWLSILAVVHRVSSLIQHRQAAAQQLAARVVEGLGRSFRFDGPPQVGELVMLLDMERATVVEVAQDATVALIERWSDGETEVRRAIELLRLPPKAR